MVSRTYGRGRPLNAPAAFIHPCQPIVAKQPPSGPGWAHELKHDGYRLQIHVRDGRVRLYTINGADWSKRYPLIVEAAAHIQGGQPFSMLKSFGWTWAERPSLTRYHSRVNDERASACAFDLLMLNGDDLRRKPYVERKAALRKLLRHGRGIQYVEHAESHGDRLFEAVCKLGLEGIVSKKLDAPYRSGPSKTWIKVKNPKAPAATRAVDGTF
jgi:bifunctional non-homologous end joining protein LigD